MDETNNRIHYVSIQEVHILFKNPGQNKHPNTFPGYRDSQFEKPGTNKQPSRLIRHTGTPNENPEQSRDNPGHSIVDIATHNEERISTLFLWFVFILLAAETPVSHKDIFNLLNF